MNKKINLHLFFLMSIGIIQASQLDNMDEIIYEDDNQQVNKKPDFICEACSKSFSKLFSLKRHQATHSENKPHKCTYENCTKSFKIKDGLKIHIDLTHSENKPHKCTYENCTKAFKLNQSLKSHIESFHYQKRYKCLYKNCNCVFKLKPSLIAHEKKKHLNFISDIRSNTSFQEPCIVMQEDDLYMSYNPLNDFLVQPVPEEVSLLIAKNKNFSDPYLPLIKTEDEIVF